jgi:hypothetical protein
MPGQLYVCTVIPSLHCTKPFRKFIKVLTDARTVMSVAIANFVLTLSADFQMHQISWDAILHDFGYSRDFTQENGRHRNPLMWNQLLRWLYEGSESMAACSPSTLQSNIHNNLIGTYFIIVSYTQSSFIYPSPFGRYFTICVDWAQIVLRLARYLFQGRYITMNWFD